MIDLSLQDMRYVCFLAEHLHFGKAAEAAATSQPNLSMQIQKVERELGLMLFERSNKMVRISPSGARVIPIFESIISQAVSLDDLSESPFEGTLSLGLFPTLAPYLLPHLVKQLKTSFPLLQLEIIEEKTDVLVDQLSSGKLDFILAALPIDAPNFEFKFLFKDPFYVAVSVDHSLASHQCISLSDLKNERVMLLEEGHCLRDQSLDICSMLHLEADFSFQSSSLEALRAMVAVNAGVTLVPQLCVDDHPLIRYIPMDGERFSRKIGLYWRKTYSQSALVELLGKSVRLSVPFSS